MPSVTYLRLVGNISPGMCHDVVTAFNNDPSIGAAAYHVCWRAGSESDRRRHGKCNFTEPLLVDGSQQWLIDDVGSARVSPLYVGGPYSQCFRGTFSRPTGGGGGAQC
jgi:hypothetical protein